VLLDFTGGVFSFAQMIVESVALGKPLFAADSQGFNIVKFLLSIIAIIFDLIFMFQHYVLYRDQWAGKKAQKGRMAKLQSVNRNIDELKESGIDGEKFISNDARLPPDVI